MTLDSRLNWEEHINKLKAISITALNTIRVIAGKMERSENPKKLYRAICRTKMDYGCQLYNTASAGRLKKTDSINREGIRIYGCFQNFTS